MITKFDKYPHNVLSLPMIRILYTIIFCVLMYAQDDRSTVFSTGNPPLLGVGWDITCTDFSNEEIGDINEDQSLDVLDVVTIVSFILGNATPTATETLISDINEDTNIDVLDVIILVNLILNGADSECTSGLSAAVKFATFSEYTFEAFSLIFETEELEGDGLFEVRLHLDSFDSPGEILGSWELTVDANIAREYYVFTGGTDCILLEPFESYWISVHPKNNQDQALWLFSENDYTYTSSNDMGQNWSESLMAPVGCTKIFGEQIYESNGTEPSLDTVYDWSLEDINPNSEYYYPDYGEKIGPGIFIDNQHVSVYYFGKAG